MQLVSLDHSALDGELAKQVQNLLQLGFPDMAGQYYGDEMPRKIILLLDDGAVVGHLAAYIRGVTVGGDPMDLGRPHGLIFHTRYIFRLITLGLIEAGETKV